MTHSLTAYTRGRLIDRRVYYGVLMLLALLFMMMGKNLQGQNPVGPDQIVRGAVRSDSGVALSGILVSVTMGPILETHQATSDANGGFSVRFANPTGEYLVHAAGPGWKTFRIRIKHTASDTVVEVPITLTRAASNELATVAVEAEAPRPERDDPSVRNAGAIESTSGGVTASVAPQDAGNAFANAATVPGVSASATGVSILGLPSDQTLVTLNGAAFPAAQVPSDVRTRTRVTTSTYDPSRGGFAGGEVAIDVAPGSVISLRTAHLSLTSPTLTAGSENTRLPNLDSRSVQGGIGGQGSLGNDAFVYNGAVQARIRDEPTFDLERASPATLDQYGLTTDSTQALFTALSRLGLSRTATPNRHRRGDYSGLIRVDHQPEASHTWGLLASAQLGTDDGYAESPIATFSHGSSARRTSGLLQGTYSAYTSPSVLTDVRMAISTQGLSTTPRSMEPEGILASGGTSYPRDNAIFFGGSGATGFTDSHAIWETSFETDWLVSGTNHRLKFAGDSRFDNAHHAGTDQTLGSFEYENLTSLMANSASVYSRVFSAPSQSAQVWNGSMSVGDLWRVTPHLQVLYGGRLDLSSFISPLPHNPMLDALVGHPANALPTTADVSPRVGFTWTYAREARQNFGSSITSLGTFQRAPAGVIRGGIGEFRNILAPDVLMNARTATGLGNDLLRLVCIGDAVPNPDSVNSAYFGTPAPVTCASGSQAAFADTAPPAAILAQGYRPPRSWRANLAWQSTLNGMNVGLEAIGSLGLNQPSTQDVNFNGQPQFALADEGGRLVYVPATSISPQGVVSSSAARRSSGLGTVMEYGSESRSVSQEVIVTASKQIASLGRAYLGASYAYLHARDLASSWDGTTGATAAERTWLPSNQAPTHQFILQGGHSLGKTVTATIFAEITSGMRFTPIVGSDVNGDGLMNDRAFVFGPGADSIVRGMDQLIGDKRNRDCLGTQIGRIAGPRSCEGPWRADINALLSANAAKLGLSNRASISLGLRNIAGGLDQLLHGDNHLHGWGSQAAPDPVLMYVSGFNPTTHRFTYTANPSFNTPSPALTLPRIPFEATLDVRIDIGTPISLQMLDRSLARGHDGVRPSAALIKQRYARTVPDVYRMIRAASDSLVITASQDSVLADADERYRVRVDSVWSELATYLSSDLASIEHATALKRADAATDAAWEIVREQQPIIKATLSPMQLHFLPTMVALIVNSPGKIQLRIVPY